MSYLVFSGIKSLAHNLYLFFIVQLKLNYAPTKFYQTEDAKHENHSKKTTNFNKNYFQQFKTTINKQLTIQRKKQNKTKQYTERNK